MPKHGGSLRDLAAAGPLTLLTAHSDQGPGATRAPGAARQTHIAASYRVKPLVRHVVPSAVTANAAASGSR